MIICMVFASVCFFIFAFLFLTAGENVYRAVLLCNEENEKEKIKKYNEELNEIVEDLKITGELKNKAKIKKARKIKSKIEESEKVIDKLNSGKAGILDMVSMAGYRFIQLAKWDLTNKYVKQMYEKCVQFKEKNNAMNYTIFVFGNLIGNCLLGLSISLILLGITLSMDMGGRSVIISLTALVVFAVLGYLPYDEVGTTIQKRAEDIENQFPQVVSKMALLTVSGMEVSKAWKLASNSGKGTLYDEMKRVNVELENNVAPATAYTNFMNRCNNSYTTKLATSIIQNISKGNSEIVELFRTLNKESWLEHKHNARRQGEKIQSKLLVPTMLMFVGILILVIVPVLSGFGF